MALLKKVKRRLVEPFSNFLFWVHFRKYDSGDFKFNVALSFDCDYAEDVKALPALLGLLDKYSLHASFACVGKLIELYPKIHKVIVERGHEIINHTYTHPDNEILSPSRFFNKMSFKEQEQEIRKCDEVCKNTLNVKPIGFRTPHFGRLHCKNVYEIIQKFGYKYSSSTLLTSTKYCAPFMSERGIWEIPMMTCPDHYFPLLDSWHCYRSPSPAHNKSGELFRLFKSAVNLCKKHAVPCVFYFDPQDVASHKEEFEACLRWIKETKTPTKTCRNLIKQYLLR